MDYVAMITQLMGSAAGNAASGMDRATAMRLIQSVMDAYGKIDVPKLQQLLLQKQPDTQLANIHDDAEYRGQQNSADANLNDVINSGGLTLADRAGLNAIRARSARSESAGRHAIESGMAARGTLDSGAQLAMELQGNQQAANSEEAAAAQTSAAAQQRAWAAIQQRGQNATAGLNRTNQMAEDKARAQDVINAGNAAIANTAAKYNANLPQQNFDNQMKKVAGAAGATYAAAGANAAQAKDTQQQYDAYGNIVAKGIQNASANNNSGGGGFSSNPDVTGDRGGATDLSGGHTDDLTGESTKPPGDSAATTLRQKEVVGYDEQGNPIYGYRSRN